MMRKKSWLSVIFIGILSFQLLGEEFGPLELVDIQEVCPEIRVELKYATADNLTGQIIYGVRIKCNQS